MWATMLCDAPLCCGWQEMESNYGVSVECLTEAYGKEHYHYHMQTCQWSEVAAGQIVSTPQTIKSFDLTTCTVEEMTAFHAMDFEFPMAQPKSLCGFAGWFETHFRGGETHPAVKPVTLSTAPEKGYTHWGQQVMVMDPMVHVSKGDCLSGTIEVTRQAINQRLLNVRITHRHVEAGQDPATAPQTVATYSLD